MNQHRSQLDYDLVMRNYGLNLAFQLRKVGIITAQSSEYYPDNIGNYPDKIGNEFKNKT